MEMTAEDVKFSIERILRPHIIFNSTVAAEIAPNLQSVEILGEHAIQVTLKKPMAHFLDRISDYLLVVPQRVYGTDDSLFTNTAIGTGPFRFVAKKGTEEIVLEANANYWDNDRIPKFRKLIITVISDPTDRWAAIKTGTIDFARFDGTPFVTQALHDPELKVFQTRNSWNVYLIPLWGVPEDPMSIALKDHRVRKAVTMAIDRQSLVNEIWTGHGLVLPTLRRPGARGFDPERKPLPFDPDSSKTLLAEAGYGEGLDMELHFTPGWIPYAAAEKISEMLTNVGIRTKVFSYQTKELLGKLLRKEIKGLFLLGQNTLHDDELWGGPYWYTSIGVTKAPELEKLLRDTSTTHDRKIWDERAKELERMYWQELAFMPIGVVDVIGVAGPKLNEWSTYPAKAAFMSPVMDYSGVKLEGGTI